MPQFDDFEQQVQKQESQMRKFMDIIKGDIERNIEENMPEEEEEIETAKAHL